jgi:hypothetical protein
VQCQLRGLEPGPINTFPGWQALGRTVKRGERALILCMPITRKVRDEESASNGDDANGERTFTSFMHKARWFAISQTIGDEFTPPRLPDWEAERALAALDIERIAFTDTLSKSIRSTLRFASARSAFHSGISGALISLPTVWQTTNHLAL